MGFLGPSHGLVAWFESALGHQNLYRANFDGEVPALNRRELSSSLRRGTKQHSVMTAGNGQCPFKAPRKAGVRFPHGVPNTCPWSACGLHAILVWLRIGFDSRWGHQQHGSKVFMDAYGPVTAEERDRYPLGPHRVILFLLRCK